MFFVQAADLFVAHFSLRLAVCLPISHRRQQDLFKTLRFFSATRCTGIRLWRKQRRKMMRILSSDDLRRSTEQSGLQTAINPKTRNFMGKRPYDQCVSPPAITSLALADALRP